MKEDKKPKGVADIIIAMGSKPKKGVPDDDEYSGPKPNKRGQLAGDDLLEALNSGDGQDVYDAICAIIDVHESEGYELEDEEEVE